MTLDERALLLLGKISAQLSEIQATMDRIEKGAGEFVPTLRELLKRRATRAAMKWGTGG